VLRNLSCTTELRSCRIGGTGWLHTGFWQVACTGTTATLVVFRPCRENTSLWGSSGWLYGWILIGSERSCLLSPEYLHHLVLRDLGAGFIGMGKWKRCRRESDVGREILGNCGEGWAIEGFRRLERCGW